MPLGDEGLLRDVVSSVVHEAGFDLEEIAVVSAGRRRLVRVAIDRDAGVDLDAAAEVSRDLSTALDAEGDRVLGGAPYTLEVTSPGIGRPLTEPRHFRRAAGRLVTLTLSDGTVVTARVLSLVDEQLTVLAGPDGLQRRTVPLAEITRARVEVEFSAPSAAVTAVLADAGVRIGNADSDGPAGAAAWSPSAAPHGAGPLSAAPHGAAPQSAPTREGDDAR